MRFDNKLTERVEINRGACQGCPLSPTLLNINIKEILLEWSTDNIQVIQLTRNKRNKNTPFCR
jgi:Fe-S cluster biogenesis protein NfuA